LAIGIENKDGIEKERGKQEWDDQPVFVMMHGSA
jgi:hypothetical protein